MFAKWLTATAAFALWATPALAELPPSVAAMLDEAIANGSEAEVDAVAKFARKALPGQTAEIDAHLSDYRNRLAANAAAKAQEAQAERDGAGFFSGWTGKGELGGFLSAGNSDTRGLAAGLALTRETTDWRFNLRANADYQRSNGATSAEQISAAVEPNYKVGEHLFFYGLGQFERDPFQGFDARYILSGGVGYRPISKDHIKLDLKAGPAWRNTDFIRTVDENALSGLGSANLYWKLSPTLSLNEAASILAQTDKSTLTALTSVDAKINGSLSARLSYQVRHETNPPTGLKNTDTLSRMTLVYGF